MNNLQAEIIKALDIVNPFDVDKEIRRRIDFMKDYLKSNGLHTLVLGISGGVDSLTAGALAQRAVTELRAEDYDATFIAMRLPYGVQADESDCRQSLDFISPDRIVTVNIKGAVDAMLDAIDDPFANDAERDFVKGNIKARQRMIAQYAIAGKSKGIVIGTDHGSEAIGFFTKFGDGGCDITPLTGLVKRYVRAIAQHLGAPANLVGKVPTADLEDLDPQKPDEVALGVTYEEIDDFMLGKEVNERASTIITKFYQATAHKRALPYTPFS
ncbi:ammonia-dependent NAD(+) synthetase [Pseudomonas fluorescens]|uniref:ammonia-dependent NAD(+) synthetase n=1 Tax=Pseudomonas TaxID=286 RepID=UPI000F01FD1E|nr:MULTISPECIES: ammonia-dependent NAD(+) synthetase [Pseudomonas]MBD8088665.1 ammonia-dependent NAD(+) synthetase [Pseudomonas fluorescens]MBD8614874.1 ammonia-dependent NAD(+) synthetase [Pseudomonas putida]MBD8681442.1 ammonia-dependent NAD(+) synthetase [Pseudomonas sp. CFBP 13719]